MGLLGAVFSALLSKERWADKIVGGLAGFILCVVFAKHASFALAGGNYPEVFGFIFGAAGKSTAEMLLKIVREKILKAIKGDTE